MNSDRGILDETGISESDLLCEAFKVIPVESTRETFTKENFILDIKIKITTNIKIEEDSSRPK